jgi:hypothetical protein
MQPVHKMNEAIQVLTHAMPSRWAFEGLLLLEIEDRPTWVPPGMPVQSVSERLDHVDASLRDGNGELPPDPAAPGTAEANENEVASSEDSQPADTRTENARERPPPEPEPKDMAEDYFPSEAERMGVRASCISLMSMLICLVAAIHIILRSRDIH